MAEHPTLTAAAEAGDRLAALKIMRRIVAESIEKTSSAREIGTLSKRLDDLMAEIEDLEKVAPRAANPLDELAERRAAEGKAAPRTTPARR